MELTVEQQIFDRLGKAKKIMIAMPEALNADAVASALALKLLLQKMGIAAVVCSSGKVPEQIEFLPGVEMVQHEVPHGDGFIITVDTTQKKLDELSYQVEGETASILLKSKTVNFDPHDIRFAYGKPLFDAVVILDCRNLEDLGKIFGQQADVFFETPKINIDNKAANEYFGAINLIDITATSVAEILFALFENSGAQMDEDIATCLLTGIIAKTNSFQHVQTTPKSFVRSSQLVALGARQQEIVKHMYKTKSLSYLKLWGRTLARLHQVEELSFVYSSLTSGDLQKTEAGTGDLSAVLSELAENVSQYRVVAVLGETDPQDITVEIAVSLQLDAERLLGLLQTPGKIVEPPAKHYKIIQLKMQMSLFQAERTLTAAVTEIVTPGQSTITS